MNKMSSRKLSGFFAYVLLAVVLTSCSLQDVCNYNGNQIVEKAESLSGMWFRFRKDGEITGRIYVLEYDWNKYSVGDTLYCR